ncbi:MAG: hypothetical protein Q8M15_13940 [Bacteroidota bacterium]|nr:hypothetical protein [Bacteroidota bacterium]
MNKQLISILSVFASIVLALVLYFYFSKIDDKNLKPIEVVPDNAALIIEAGQSSATLRALADPDFMKRLLMNEKVLAFYQKLIYLDSLFMQHEDMADWFVKGKAVYSFHSFSNKSVGFFMAVQTFHEINAGKTLGFFQKNFPGRFKLSKRRFNNEEIYDFTDFKEGMQFSIAFKNKLMLFSFDGSLVEMSLLKNNQLKANAKVEDKLSFVQNGGDGFNLYINYKNLPNLLQSAASENYQKGFGLFDNFGEKAIYNIQYNDAEMILKGAASSHESNFQFLDLLNGQAPIENTIIPFLPEQINFAFSFNYNGYSSWFKNVNEYMLSKKLYVKYSTYIDSIEVNLQVRFSEKMASKFGNHVSLISLNETGIWKDSCYITAVEVTDEAGFEQILDQMHKSFMVKYDNDTLKKSNDTLLVIKKAYLGDAFKFYFTDMFEGIDANYYIKHKGYFYFANNAPILRALQNKWQQNQLLVNIPSFKDFEEKLAPQSNLELIINNEHAVNYALNFVNKPWYSILSQNLGTIKRAQWIGVQYAGSFDKVFASQICIRFNLSKADKTEEIWNIRLDSNLLSDPFVVFNKSLGTHVIIVEDAFKQLQMIDRDGKILWKKQIDGQIISDFTELNLFRNDKIQWVFNTERYIYIIDENGKNISGWPAWIPTGTKYPVAVCDFNKDGNYQFFASGNLYKATGYSSQGRLLANWNPKDVWPNLKSALQSFYMGNNPLLGAINEKGRLSIFTALGQKHKGLGLDTNYKWIDYRLHNIDTGNILILGLDSARFYTIHYSSTLPAKVKTLSAAGFTSFEPLNIDEGISAYLFKSSTGVLIKDENDRTRYQKTFPDSSLTHFSWNYIGDSYKISFYNSQLKEMHVQNSSGIPYKPFPMAINRNYAIGNLFNDGENWLICSDQSNRLFLYRIK